MTTTYNTDTNNIENWREEFHNKFPLFEEGGLVSETMLRDAKYYSIRDIEDFISSLLQKSKEETERKTREETLREIYEDFKDRGWVSLLPLLKEIIELKGISLSDQSEDLSPVSPENL